MELDPAVVQRHLRDAAAATTTDAQGKAYEALAVYLFECVPGCFTERDIISFFGAEQIDVGVGNPRLPEGLPLLPTAVIVECKDWVKPVDSKTVGYFINILANRGVEAGILIAANGITGDPDELSRAHSLGISAVARGIKVLIMTTAEIETLTCTADLTGLLNHRYLRSIMSGGMGIPSSAIGAT
jgi:Restriction endonuclease